MGHTFAQLSPCRQAQCSTCSRAQGAGAKPPDQMKSDTHALGLASGHNRRFSRGLRVRLKRGLQGTKKPTDLCTGGSQCTTVSCTKVGEAGERLKRTEHPGQRVWQSPWKQVPGGFP